MLRSRNFSFGLVMALVLLFAPAIYAADTAHSVVGVQGYDLVSFFTQGKAEKGNGHHVAVYQGISYLFSSDENKQAFEAAPVKYLPAYGGWCAYGVAVNKKFVGDPEVWKIVDNKLYFNLDKKVAAIWQEDIAGNLKKAEENWPKIADKNPSEL